MGYDAALVEQVERRSGLKGRPPLFIYAGPPRSSATSTAATPTSTVAYPDGDRVAEGYFAVCCNTNPYTAVGNRPFDIAPDASLDRGLAMVTVRSMRATRFLRIMADALAGQGKLQRNRWAHYRHDVDELVVEGIDGRPFPYQIDGDFLGEIDRIDLRHVPDIIDLVLPVGFHDAPVE
ncbi:MAG: hypothetical protein R2711_15935 [Acidimicrobiales bacterium]